MTALIPRRRRPHATTVCAICSAIYLTTDVHVCTQETPTEGDPMTQYTPPFDHPDKVYALPGDGNRHQDIRLACLRLAAETGMDATEIQTTATEWATFVLGANQKEN